MKHKPGPRGTLCLILALTLLTGAAWAESPGAGTRSGSLRASFPVDNNPVQGAEFRLWRVGEPDRENYLVWTPDIAKYALTLNLEEEQASGDLARTLWSCLKRDGVAPIYTGVTDASGAVRWTGLDPGLYLIAGEPYVRTDTGGSIWTCRPVPMLTIVWGGMEETVEIKHEDTCVPPAPDRKTVTRKVIKVWEDEADADGIRPDSVTVELLRDGEVFKTASLCEKNHWQYTWTGLDAYSDWDVVEKAVPEGYTAAVRKDGIVWTVTNHHAPVPPDEPVPPDNPDPPDEPTPPDNSDTPDEPTPPDNPEPPDSNSQAKPQEKLPQTGLDWRPVWVLAGTGLLLLFAGLFTRRRKP